MSKINYHIIQGYLGSNFDHQTSSEDRKNWAHASLAFHASKKNENGEWKTETDWYRISFFGKNIIDHIIREGFKKGDQVIVEGTQRIIKSEKDGKSYTTIQINGRNIIRVSKEEKKQETTNTTTNDIMGEDDIPF